MKYKDCAVVLNDIHDQNQPPNNNNNGSSTYVNGQLQAASTAVDVKTEPLEEGCLPRTNGWNASDEEDNDGNDQGQDQDDDEDGDDGEFLFEYEEAERPLPPLYLLKDEAAGEKWVLMTDLCNFLKLKSKEAVLRQICSSTTPITSNSQTTNNNTTTTTTTTTTTATTTTNGTNGTSREMIRELKLEDFLSRSSCLQLLYAGEKLNINSNKVVLVKYNENVRNLLQVQTVVTKI